MQRPTIVSAISALFVMAAIFLWSVGIVKLLAPNAISLMSASPFMFGLELAGPYMVLLVAAGWAAVGWGLFRLHNWARWASMAVLVASVAALVPKISQAEIGTGLLWYGLQIALYAAAGRYLAQSPAVIESFNLK
jgi:hypothetical protein